MQTSELVKAAMERSQITSMRKLATEMDVSQSIVSLWANDQRVPEFEHAAVLAEMAGLPAARTAAALRLPIANGKKARAVLKKMASAAALFLAIYTSIPQAVAGVGSTLHKDDSLYITYNRGWLARFLNALIQTIRFRTVTA